MLDDIIKERDYCLKLFTIDMHAWCRNLVSDCEFTLFFCKFNILAIILFSKNLSSKILTFFQSNLVADHSNDIRWMMARKNHRKSERCILKADGNLYIYFNGNCTSYNLLLTPQNGELPCFRCFLRKCLNIYNSEIKSPS